MSFTLRLNFVGLLHYVENSSSARDVKLCVVLPQAPDHDATITADAGTSLNGVNSGKLLIDNKRVVLQFGRAAGAPAAPVFDFENPVISGRVKGAVPLERIAGPHADHDTRIVSAKPPVRKVRSQVLIGSGGSFHLDASSSPPRVELPADLVGGGAAVIDVAEKFYMQVTNVDWARLIVFPLEDKTDTYTVYSIKPDQGSSATITLAQTCVPTAEVHLGDTDRDFRYQYFLLGALPSGWLLEKMPAPIIRKFSGETSFKEFKPDGCNCAGGRGLARLLDNDLEKFMSIQPSPGKMGTSEPVTG